MGKNIKLINTVHTKEKTCPLGSLWMLSEMCREEKNKLFFKPQSILLWTQKS
jgi:hypothetical protein